MRTIRNSVFETNSSSTHSLTMCMKSEFEQWKNGEILFDRWDEEFITKEEYAKKVEEWKQDFIKDNPEFVENDEDWADRLNDYVNDDKRYYTYDEFQADEYLYAYDDEFTTPNGETVVAFGLYGNDY